MAHDLVQIRQEFAKPLLMATLRTLTRFLTEINLSVSELLAACERHVSGVQRKARTAPTAPNEAWSMDFVADQLVQGTRFRALAVVDIFIKECRRSRSARALQYCPRRAALPSRWSDYFRAYLLGWSQ